MSDDVEKINIAYVVRGSFVTQFYKITVPTGWDGMTPEQRKAWAQNVIRRKNSTWRYIQINGYLY